ncbi:efflux RND transporter periplasmic adaptor subunit [Oceanibacterium hippocampi]|uniref:Cation efflux system protein CusB n=1 Tax=Oceanibacterium hippocampi TaxID=745714 RepID=A0A1Y5TK77_9PROT|nr:efflux RND transporter periplasmic adaptor subunit [Oceanibacterium hippocampi]SLN66011.1 Cation efflux system protein CusB precursor [Oceanibacterium hippocampi]
MSRKVAVPAVTILVTALVLLGNWIAASAQAPSFRFEPISSEISVGKAVPIAVRLVGADGQPVSTASATLTSTRLDMGPDGMAMMEAHLTPIDTDEPGVFAFTADIVMAGRWALTVEATLRDAGRAVRGEVIFTAAEKQSNAEPESGQRRILYYRNPMGLPDVSPVPKKDWMGMDYIPVYEEEMSGPPGTVRVSVEKVQRAGVRTSSVEHHRLIRTVRGSGIIAVDESRLTVITAKFDGFVNRLDVRTTGEAVRAGQPLLTAWIESSHLLRRMSDLATARPNTGPDAETAARNLRLFDVPESVITEIKRTRSTVRAMEFVAPSDGTVLEKPAIDGMRFSAGDELFRIADLSRVWVVVDVAEQELPFLQVGQAAYLALPSQPGRTLEGQVAFIYPELNAATRSVRVRILIPNPDGRLKLGLFVHAEIRAQVSDEPVLAIASSAVVDDGSRRVAFVARGDGLFEPRDITLGARAGSLVEVIEGLSAGEQVVVNGTFLIDAESNLQTALTAFTAESADE